MYRPDNWPKCPCEDCVREYKQIDEYGYLCDLTCRERSAWANFELGADAMLETLFKLRETKLNGLP